MRVDRSKLRLAMARACLDSGMVAALADMSRSTFENAMKGRSVRPGTLGRIARALGVDPADLTAEDKG